MKSDPDQTSQTDYRDIEEWRACKYSQRGIFSVFVKLYESMYSRNINTNPYKFKYLNWHNRGGDCVAMKKASVRTVADV